MILSLCLRHYSSPQLIFRRFSEDTSQASISNAAEFCFFLSYFAKLLMCTIMCNTIIVYRYYYYYYDIVFYVLHLQVCLYIIVSVKHFVTSLLIQYVLNSNSTIQQLGRWPWRDSLDLLMCHCKYLSLVSVLPPVDDRQLSNSLEKHRPAGSRALYCWNHARRICFLSLSYVFNIFVVHVTITQPFPLTLHSLNSTTSVLQHTGGMYC